VTASVDPRILNKTRDEVRTALHELCDPVKRGFLTDSMQVSTHIAPSLLDQLREAVATGTERGGRSRGVGLPLAVDAHDLLVEIDRRISCRRRSCEPGGECFAHELGVSLVGSEIEPNLREVVAACGVSLDLEAILGVRRFLTAWITGIGTLFDPPQRWALWDYACPVCQAKTVYRLDDSDGEEKRTAALEVSWLGTGRSKVLQCVRCLACQEEWQPNQVLFLGRLLGCELPGLSDEGEPAA
jgi:hypothetical protein